MRFDLERLPTDPVHLQKILREMVAVMEQERAELETAKATVQVQILQIEKLEHRAALRIPFGRSSEKMEIAQLRLMFDEVEVPQPANDDAPAAVKPKSARKAGARAPIPAHVPRRAVEHQPGPCPQGCGGAETKIGEDVTEVLDYIAARFRVLRHVRLRVACRTCEQIRRTTTCQCCR